MRPPGGRVFLKNASNGTVAIFRVVCRGGIYAARCSLPGKSTYRGSRTGRNYASPANPPKVRNISIQRFNSPPGGRIL